MYFWFKQKFRNKNYKLSQHEFGSDEVTIDKLRSYLYCLHISSNNSSNNSGTSTDDERKSKAVRQLVNEFKNKPKNNRLK